jgi:hypothetical protein
MASRVLVSNGATNINTANGFVLSDKSNLGLFSTTTLALSTARTLSVTYASNHNSAGIILALYGANDVQSKSVSVYLQQIMGTCTVNATTDEVTFTSHGFSDGQSVMITAATTQPGGITVNTEYFARPTDSSVPANTFFLYDTAAHAIAGGATGKVDITSTGSGTLTLYAVRGTQTLTGASITNSNTDCRGNWVLPFSWTAYAVDTTASKWRYLIIQSSSGTNNWALRTSDATNMFYIEFSDATATFDLTAASNSDTLVCKDQVTINASATLKAQLGTGDTTNGVCGIVCKSSTALTSTSGNENLIWENSMTGAPTSSYTLTLDGMLSALHAHAGIRIGSSDYKVANAKQAIISMSTRTVGTTTTGIYGAANTGYTTNAEQKSSFHFFGAHAALAKCVTDALAAAGATAVTTTTDVTGWGNGKDVVVCERNTEGNQVAYRTLNGAPTGPVSGVYTINLSSALATYSTPAGTTVMYMEDTGIKVIGDGTNKGVIELRGASNIIQEGVQFKDIHNYGSTNGSTSYEDTDNNTEWYFGYCTHYSTNGTILYCHFVNYVPSVGMLCEYNQTYNVNWGIAYFQTDVSDAVTYDNNIITGLASGGIGPAGQNAIITDNKFIGYGGLVIYSSGWTLKDNYFWGYGIYSQYAAGRPEEMSGNQYNSCLYTIQIYGANNVFSVKAMNSIFGNLRANTYEFYLMADSYVDWEEFSPTVTSGAVSVLTTSNKDAVDGTRILFNQHNDTPTDFRQWFRQGKVFSVTGNKLKQQVLQATEVLQTPFRFGSQTVANKKMAAVANCQIQNANYYAGTYTAPTLAVYADNDLVTPLATDVAATNTTAQVLVAVFTPTTSNNEIVPTFEIKSDGSGSDTDVHWDSLQVNVRNYGDTFDSYPLVSDHYEADKWGSILTPTANPYITEANSATVAAYTGIVIDHSAGTLTLSEDHTIEEVYDYTQLDLTDDDNMGYDEWFVTVDGVNFTSDYDIVLETGTDLTGNGTIEMASGKTFTKEGTATYDGIIIYSDATREVHVKLNTLTANSTVQIYNTSDSSEIYKDVVTGTSLDYIYTWSTDKNIRVRVRETEHIPYEATGTITNTGFTLNVSQENNDIYTDNGVDGSTVTECSLSEGVIGIFIDDPDNVTTFQRIYNWYMYALATTEFIDDQTNLITANSTRDYVFDDTIAIKNMDESNPLYIYGANVSNTSEDNALVDATGGSIFIRGDYPAASPKENTDYMDSNSTKLEEINNNVAGLY